MTCGTGTGGGKTTGGGFGACTFSTGSSMALGAISTGLGGGATGSGCGLMAGAGRGLGTLMVLGLSGGGFSRSSVIGDR
jgi:hypothetical protein